jgi:hypothetical protein
LETDVSVIVIYMFIESLCLLGEELVMMSHPGVQRDILSQLELTGPSALVYPNKLFHHCIAIGLKPVYVELSTTFNCPVVSCIVLSDQ